MANFLDRNSLARILLGTRTGTAIKTLPATTTAELFTITGGSVLITQLWGVVATVVETKANNAKLQSNPTSGATADICTTLDITAAASYSIITVTGVPADAMLKYGAGCAPELSRGLIVPAGAIELSCDATSTGSIQWFCFWHPLTVGAYVEAA